MDLKKNNNNGDYLMIGTTIHIVREILCLPYAGFFCFRKVMELVSGGSIISGAYPV